MEPVTTERRMAAALGKFVDPVATIAVVRQAPAEMTKSLSAETMSVSQECSFIDRDRSFFLYPHNGIFS
jgi:hypothetical protein